MHKITIPLAMLTFRDAPYMRVYISESVIGFSQLGFRLQTTVPHSFFRYFSCMTLESQRCLAEMLEFQLGRNRCSELLLHTRHDELDGGFLVTRKEIGHVLVYTFHSMPVNELQ